MSTSVAPEGPQPAGMAIRGNEAEVLRWPAAALADIGVAEDFARMRGTT
jgi:hypothetical protein